MNICLHTIYYWCYSWLAHWPTYLFDWFELFSFVRSFFNVEQDRQTDSPTNLLDWFELFYLVDSFFDVEQDRLTDLLNWFELFSLVRSFFDVEQDRLTDQLTSPTDLNRTADWLTNLPLRLIWTLFPCPFLFRCWTRPSNLFRLRILQMCKKRGRTTLSSDPPWRKTCNNEFSLELSEHLQSLHWVSLKENLQ